MLELYLKCRRKRCLCFARIKNIHELCLWCCQWLEDGLTVIKLSLLICGGHTGPPSRCGKPWIVLNTTLCLLLCVEVLGREGSRPRCPGRTAGNGQAHLISLYIADNVGCLLLFFKQIQGCGNPSSSKSISANFSTALFCTWASKVAQTVKNPPAVQETRVQALGWEDPLEKEIGTHSSVLARRIPQTEEPGGLQSMGSQKVGHD